METIKLNNVQKNYKRNIISGGIISYIKSIFFRNFEEINAVNDVTFSVSKGETIGLIGENGAGKSTLIKIMNGTILPTKGEVKVLGYSPFDKRNAFLKRIGVVMGQKSQLWWDLSPRETFNLYKSIYNIPDDKFNENLKRLLTLLKIEKIIDSPTRSLSLGERMKCELICSLIHDPDVLFLDEPTIGLDFITQKEIRKFLNDYKKRNETTIILTSHSIDDITALSDRLIVISKGKKIYDGSIKSLSNINDEFVYLDVSITNIHPIIKRISNAVTNITNYGLTTKIEKKKIDYYLKVISLDNDIISFKIRSLDMQDIIEELYLNGEQKNGNL
ncbi:ATP-binding cassette domain-containing protein [Apilactobacillus kunkeei]|uniref:ABC transporter ATP-binding protein n=1 Tax=Apilactobacillus kunkeei TaxID=148814 RepID=UPI00200A0019|nr:ATP-binding cassette domain-containing protein [Apilactobacillus kunkeei]MCK8635471.1 ATP-binding cassette domain-containing protein [Apilactobacillus kunkeei]